MRLQVQPPAPQPRAPTVARRVGMVWLRWECGEDQGALFAAKVGLVLGVSLGVGCGGGRTTRLAVSLWPTPRPAGARHPGGAQARAEGTKEQGVGPKPTWALATAPTNQSPHVARLPGCRQWAPTTAVRWGPPPPPTPIPSLGEGGRLGPVSCPGPPSEPAPSPKETRARSLGPAPTGTQVLAHPPLPGWSPEGRVGLGLRSPSLLYPRPLPPPPAALIRFAAVGNMK